MYVIQHSNGSWWNDICWGVEQVRTEYTSLDYVPRTIEALELWVNSERDPLDAFYFDGNNETIARIYKI